MQWTKINVGPGWAFHYSLIHSLIITQVGTHCHISRYVRTVSSVGDCHMTNLEDSSQINDPKRVTNAPRMCAAMLSPPWIAVAIHRPGWYSLISRITLVGRLLQGKIVVWTRHWRRRNKSYKGDIWQRLLVGKAHLFFHLFVFIWGGGGGCCVCRLGDH